MLTKKEKEALKKLLEYYEDDGITLEKLCDCSKLLPIKWTR